MHAVTFMVGALCVLAIAYRYYSAFLAARVLALDDARTTPAHEHNDVVTTLIAESRNLGAEHRDLVQRAQLGYVGQWVALLRVLRPEEDQVVSRLKVQAAQMLATSMCRTLYLRRRPGFRRDLAAICLQLQD